MTDQSTEPLLPCPFCGGEAEIEQRGDRRRSTVYACTNCGCRLETGEEWGHGKAWNTRMTIKEPAHSVCPACGCEERNSRGLLTCECPAVSCPSESGQQSIEHPIPDANCITLPDGSCVGVNCMHDVVGLDRPAGQDARWLVAALEAQKLKGCVGCIRADAENHGQPLPSCACGRAATRFLDRLIEIDGERHA